MSSQQVLLLIPIIFLINSFFPAVLATEEKTSLPIQCPAPEQLRKEQKGDENLQWVAPGGWRSYSPSFATQVKEFKAVEWQGVGIGQIACAYVPIPATSFPVVLSYKNYVYFPTGKNWKNKKGSAVCRSNQPSDCPFVTKPPKPHVDVNQALEDLRTPRNTQSFQ